MYEFVPSKWEGNYRSAASIIIPAKHERTGSLTVSDDGEELTVEIGRLHHAHFSAYSHDAEAIEQRLAAATDDAARFVADLFADRVYICVEYVGARGIGSSHDYIDSDGQPTGWVRLPDASLTHNEATRSVRYLWSGPIDKT